jgi:hypothetical protein
VAKRPRELISRPNRYSCDSQPLHRCTWPNSTLSSLGSAVPQRNEVGFAVEAGASFSVKQGAYVASAVGQHLQTDMGAVVFYDHGTRRTACKIKAKHYSAKSLAKCIADHRQTEL